MEGGADGLDLVAPIQRRAAAAPANDSPPGVRGDKGKLPDGGQVSLGVLLAVQAPFQARQVVSQLRSGFAAGDICEMFPLLPLGVVFVLDSLLLLFSALLGGEDVASELVLEDLAVFSCTAVCVLERFAMLPLHPLFLVDPLLDILLPLA